MTVSQSVLCRFRDRVIVSGALAGAMVGGGSLPHATRRYGRWRGVTIVSRSARCRYATGIYCQTTTTSALKGITFGTLKAV